MATAPKAQRAYQSPYQISPKRVPKLWLSPTLLITSYLSKSKDKRQMSLQSLKTSPPNAPKATRPVQDLRSINMDLTLKFRQRQSPTPRLTSRISWTELIRKEERWDGRDLENSETGKENREILDRNGDKLPEIQNNGKKFT
ncbi:MAG: hypothetical protein EZS28_015069 [Streblomastix strix]|uniref:Uncharacterized protein n=1 Tax=Streblomastix strix TaxID=222440 RepID=A0A5J4W484_9EUKA|nr:MAG: hypothetical protein EZS28_015069 [Streblomastix strix]